MSLPVFNQVCLDPTLIKGDLQHVRSMVHVLPATARCLAYRCGPEIQSGKQNIYKSLADRLYEGVTFIKRLSEADGRPTPDRRDASGRSCGIRAMRASRRRPARARRQLVTRA